MHVESKSKTNLIQLHSKTYAINTLSTLFEIDQKTEKQKLIPKIKINSIKFVFDLDFTWILIFVLNFGLERGQFDRVDFFFWN